MTIIPSRFAPVTLALLRIVSGVLFLEHGLVKLIGFPAGARPGLQPVISLLGFAGVFESVTGMLITVGLFTGTAAFLAAGEMAVAYWMVHALNSFYPAVNGGDAAILFCFVFLHLAASGPGAFSLDGRRARSGKRIS